MRVRAFGFVVVRVVCLLGAACAVVPAVRDARWIPPLPVSVDGNPVEPLPGPDGGVRIVTSGLDITPAARPTAQISLSDALAILDGTGDLPHQASGFGGRLVLASNGDWGEVAGQSPTFTDRLSWLVVFVDTPVFPYGLSVEPSLASGFYVPPHSYYDVVLAGFTCADYRLVDAVSGDFFETWQVCRRSAATQ